MNFFKIIIFALLINLTVLADLYAADEKDNSQNISELNQEEPLPLNDPFAGDAALSGMGGSLGGVTSQDTENEMSLYNFKLVGIMKGEFVSYVSLINTAGEIITLETYEELSDGVKLVNLNPSEAIFQKEDQTFITINFKNQIKEVNTLN